ncbi:leucine--tRNA ligase, partial [Candidatus Woesebacteria bacterium]|nr:leucine--tRNA ligase [Candidatus Woesebacteria bacterium]
NWIGKKEGINITYQIEGTDEAITCFTTRPDTNFGATFLVVAPEHALAKQVAAGELVPDADGETVRSSVTDYLEKASRKTELERQSEGKKKSGAFTGFYAINNLNGKRLPIWVSDFVLGGFGTGAVVGVPAHDTRDFLFAQQFSIPIIRVVVGKDGDTSPIEKEEQVQEEEGTMVNSEFLDGLEIHEATKVIMKHLEEKGWGERVTSYKLRDWLISRQRYWGAPIPVVYDPEGEPHPVKEEHLPWLLPTDVDFKPTGESPLRSSKEFIERTERLYGKGWRPEFDTMDTFVDSSWYYLRYVSSRNEEAFSDPKQMADWLPVDFYMIGPEHIVLHLLYSRFFTKFLRDEGHLNFSEPFQKMRHQGMILGPDGKKMSKSKGNVINPDEIIEKFGADCLRMYEMFMGPIESDKPWNVTAVMGVYRFLQRLESTISAELSAAEQIMSVAGEMRVKVRQKLHNTLKKVTLDIPASKFNTAIASLMELLNEWETARRKAGEKSILTQDELSLVVRMIAPFAPFLAEELWQELPADVRASQRRESEELPSVHLTVWPAFDSELAKPASVVIPVQINGKVRAKLQVAQELLIEHTVILEQALSHPDVLKHIEGKKIKKQLYIAGKIVSIVIE